MKMNESLVRCQPFHFGNGASLSIYIYTVSRTSKYPRSTKYKARHSSSISKLQWCCYCCIAQSWGFTVDETCKKEIWRWLSGEDASVLILAWYLISCNIVFNITYFLCPSCSYEARWFSFHLVRISNQPAQVPLLAEKTAFTCMLTRHSGIMCGVCVCVVLFFFQSNLDGEYASLVQLRAGGILWTCDMKSKERSQ